MLCFSNGTHSSKSKQFTAALWRCWLFLELMLTTNVHPPPALYVKMWKIIWRSKSSFTGVYPVIKSSSIVIVVHVLSPRGYSLCELKFLQGESSSQSWKCRVTLSRTHICPGGNNSDSPGILSQKVGQPATNCKRRFFNGFWSRNMSSITYQKSPKIRVGEVDEKRVFFRALYRLILRCMKTRLYVLPVVLLEFETPYSMD